MLMLLKSTKLFPCSALFRALIGVLSGPRCVQRQLQMKVPLFSNFSQSTKSVLAAGRVGDSYRRKEKKNSMEFLKCWSVVLQ